MENNKAPSRKKHVFWQIIKEISNIRYLYISTGTSIIEGVCFALIAYEGGQLFDKILAKDLPAMWQVLFLLTIIALVFGICVFLKDSLFGAYIELGVKTLRQKTVRALEQTKLLNLGKLHSGELSSRVFNDLNSLINGIRPVFLTGVSFIITNTLQTIALFLVDWKLTLIILAVAPVMLWIQWLSSKPMKKYRQQNLAAVDGLSAVVNDSFGAMETVKSLGLEQEMMNRFEAAQKKQVDAAVSESRMNAILSPIGTLSWLAPQIIVTAIGGLFVVRGDISIGELLMFITLSGTTLSFIRESSYLMGNIRQLSAACERVVELWNLPKERQQGQKNMPIIDENTNAVALSQVNFSYAFGEEDATNTVTNITFSVKPGQFVAFVGESGCGKSTVLKLASSLYEPNSGTISFWGRDLSDWNLNSLRDYVAYITQETFLFPGSLYENISCMRNTCTKQEVLVMLERVGLLPFVLALPQGLDTEVGEKGAYLSGGQKQRIAIARALLSGAKLLLFDEATSALDTENEKAVIHTLTNLENSPAIVLVSHRLATTMDANEILVMDSGRIIQQGAPADIAAVDGPFKEMLKKQTIEVSA